MPALLLSHRFDVTTAILNEELYAVFDPQTRSFSSCTDLGIVGDVVNLARVQDPQAMSTATSPISAMRHRGGSLGMPWDFRMNHGLDAG